MKQQLELPHPRLTQRVLTTTKVRIHDENETRLLSLATNDSREQTARILARLAARTDNDDEVDLSEWKQLQSWLQTAEHRVWIPYAQALAALIPPVAVRLRRDFGSVLALIKAHAILHQLTRERDSEGRIIATLDDYEMVYGLIAKVVSDGVGSTMPPIVRETVTIVKELQAKNPKDVTGVVGSLVAKKLKVDKSTASRRLAAAVSAGHIVNDEVRRGHPGRWVVADAMPADVEVLPQPHNLRATAITPEPLSPNNPENGCAVARVPEGEEKDPGEPPADADIAALGPLGAGATVVEPEHEPIDDPLPDPRWAAEVRSQLDEEARHLPFDDSLLDEDG